MVSGGGRQNLELQIYIEYKYGGKLVQSLLLTFVVNSGLSVKHLS